MGSSLLPIMLADIGIAGHYGNPDQVEVPETTQSGLARDRDIERAIQLDGATHPGGSRGLVGCINGIWSAQWSKSCFVEIMENRSMIKASSSTAIKIKTTVLK